MKVLLISANTCTRPHPVYPLGLDYVAGAISDRHEVRILDLNTPGTDQRLETILTRSAPDVVGISIRNVDTTDAADPMEFIDSYRHLTERIAAASPAIRVLGGSAFTMFPEAFLAALDPDYGIIGEGERLAGLLNALENGGNPLDVPGVVTRNRQPAHPGIWPSMPRRRFSGSDPHVRFYLDKGGMLNIQTKRGCPFRCIYCTYPYIEGRRTRPFDPDAVARTARTLQAAGARFFFITDATFNSDMGHSLAVARAFERAGLSIPWGAFFAPFSPPPDYFRQMADAGLTHVEFGTESLSGRVLKAYGKPFRPKDVTAAHRAALSAGLHVAHYFILGGPGESPSTVDATLERAEHLEKTVRFFFCGMRIYPHTRLQAMAIAEHQIDAAHDLIAPIFYRCSGLSHRDIVSRVRHRAANRLNWVVGSGGDETAGIVSRLYDRGHTGPLWEHLIR